MGSSEDNEAVVRVLPGRDRREPRGAGRDHQPDFLLHDPSSPEEVRGVEGLKALVESYRNAVPDLRVTIEHQFSEGDYVATRWTASGTHEGELMNVPATCRDVTLTGITVSRCQDGKIVEEWEVSDVFGLLHQNRALAQMVAS